MRSLFVVKHDRTIIEKTAALNMAAGYLKPDLICLDLEDSVAPKDRPAVKKLYKDVLQDGILSSHNTFIRISSLDELDEVNDQLSMFIGEPGLVGFALPKVETPDIVVEIDQMIKKIEKDKGILSPITKLMPIVETPVAYFHLDKIALASKRNVVMTVGSVDFICAMTCVDHSLAYDAFFGKMAMAARAAGINAMWGAHGELDDIIGFENTCMKMKRSGYTRAVAINPMQVSAANAIYSLIPDENNWAEETLNRDGKVIDATQSSSAGKSRQIIGPPHRKKASAMMKYYQPLTVTNSESCIRGTMPSESNIVPFSIGKIVPIPKKLKVSESWGTLWDSLFPNESRFHQVMTGCNNQLPFYLAYALGTSTMSSFSNRHVVKVDLCTRNIFQNKPLSPGDTVQVLYQIDDVKKVSDKNSIVSSTHRLVDQADETILQFEKETMFPTKECKIINQEKPQKQATTLSIRPSDSCMYKSIMQIKSNEVTQLFPCQFQQPNLNTGQQLLIHDLVQVFGESEVRMLGNLLGIYVDRHQYHSNKIQYSGQNLVVPDPFVLAAGIANTALDLGEVVYEDVVYCANINKVSFGDHIGTLTYIEQCKESKGNKHLEEVLVKHIIVKQLDMKNVLQFNVPFKLVAESDKMRPTDVELLCATSCPLLHNKIACIVARRIVRACP